MATTAAAHTFPRKRAAAADDDDDAAATDGRPPMKRRAIAVVARFDAPGTTVEDMYAALERDGVIIVGAEASRLPMHKVEAAVAAVREHVIDPHTGRLPADPGNKRMPNGNFVDRLQFSPTIVDLVTDATVIGLLRQLFAAAGYCGDEGTLSLVPERANFTPARENEPVGFQGRGVGKHIDINPFPAAAAVDPTRPLTDEELSIKFVHIKPPHYFRPYQCLVNCTPTPGGAAFGGFGVAAGGAHKEWREAANIFRAMTAVGDTGAATTYSRGNVSPATFFSAKPTIPGHQSCTDTQCDCRRIRALHRSIDAKFVWPAMKAGDMVIWDVYAPHAGPIGGNHSGVDQVRVYVAALPDCPRNRQFRERELEPAAARLTAVSGPRAHAGAIAKREDVAFMDERQLRLFGFLPLAGQESHQQFDHDEALIAV